MKAALPFLLGLMVEGIVQFIVRMLIISCNGVTARTCEQESIAEKVSIKGPQGDPCFISGKEILGGRCPQPTDAAGPSGTHHFGMPCGAGHTPGRRP